MSKVVKFAIVKGDEISRVRLKSFRNKNDGTTDVDIEYDDEFLATIKAELKKTDVTNAELSAYVGKLLDKATNGIDGYRIEVENVK
jgi:hypothetical protein